MRTLSLSWSGARQGLITSGLNHVMHAEAGKMAKDPPTEQGEFMGQIRKNHGKRYIWDGNRWAELHPTVKGFSAKILSKNGLVHSNLKLNTNDTMEAVKNKVISTANAANFVESFYENRWDFVGALSGGSTLTANYFGLTTLKTISSGYILNGTRFQSHTHYLTPLKGHGAAGAINATHMNINNLHIIYNPKYWGVLTSNCINPFRY